MGKLQDKLKEILDFKWRDEDKKTMIGMMENAIYYRRLIPKTIEKDIIKCIDICLQERRDLDYFRANCTCKHQKTSLNGDYKTVVDDDTNKS